MKQDTDVLELMINVANAQVGFGLGVSDETKARWRNEWKQQKELLSGSEQRSEISLDVS